MYIVTIYLGVFNNPVSAALAYDRKAIELKMLDKLNFPFLLDLYKSAYGE
jgi:hypothetical protein